MSNQYDQDQCRWEQDRDETTPAAALIPVRSEPMFGLVRVAADAATVAALLEWSVEGKSATVALAPVTAVLTVE